MHGRAVYIVEPSFEGSQFFLFEALMKKSNPEKNSLENSNDNSPKVNRNHKDSVFSFLFSNPDILRELYSAIEGITLPPDIPVDINTLTDVLYKDRINDVSFTINNRLVVLIEHQSTINNNIPLRLLIYIAKIYEKIVNRKKLYQTKLEKIPFPEFIVLYNGSRKYPEHTELKLSDAFKGVKGLKLPDAGIPLELTAQVYNINHGHNSEIMKKCKTLDSYSIFIEKIREYKKRNKILEKAVRQAVKYCTENNILKKFLEEHGSEVFNMLLTEWNWDEALEVAREEGREDGLEEEKLIIAKNLLAKGSMPEFVHEVTGLSLEEINEINL
jgi:predicted transposase/invertase (TIGR01784 family)